MTKTLALVGIALSAAGCMTVPGARPGAPGAEPSPNSSPDPADAPALPVEAPAKEALSQLPAAGGSLAEGASRPARAAAVGAHADPPAAGTHAQGPPRAPHTGRPAPAPEAPARGNGGAKPHKPPGTLSLPAGGPSGTGVCELGEAYGRWNPRSDQARICRAAYGG